MADAPSNPADERYMRRALALARRGAPFTATNPLVGAVAVKDSKIIAQGWHRRYGEAHAEVEALSACGAQARGATLYVTLEPCNHHGKTPPCTDAVIRSGVKRVVCAMRDPNPKAQGGLQRLREAGIECTTGVLEDEAQELNRAWLYYLESGLPFVTLKLASSIDGCIGTKGVGRSWISSSVSRAQVHRMRAHAGAVLVGAETARLDDPALTARSGKAQSQPLRVLVDPKLSVGLDAQLYTGPVWESPITGEKIAALVGHGAKVDEARKAKLSAGEVQLIELPQAGAKLLVRPLLERLVELGVCSVLCEGGSVLAGRLLCENLVNEFVNYQAPVTLGSSGVPMLGVSSFAGQFELKRARRCGPDSVVCYRIHYELSS